MESINAAPAKLEQGKAGTIHSFAAPDVPRFKYLPNPTFYEALKLRMGIVGLTILNLGTFFGIWEIIARSEILPKIFFPRPSNIVVELVNMATNGQLWYHGSFSIINLSVGFALAVAVGVPLGLAAGTFPRFNMIIAPYYWSLNSMPRLAIWPLLVLWGGFAAKVKITLIFISAIMPILINTIAGVATVDPTLLRVGRVLNATRIQLYTKIVVPYTLPFILTGLTQGMSRGLVALVVSEMLGSGRGLGYVIVRSVEEFNPAKVFAILFVLIFIAMIMVNGMDVVERRMAPWRKLMKQ
jgi:ABC-type nitrate/sulfonate/bicarbonate transport system permease component